jgi:hypothetical protein
MSPTALRSHLVDLCIEYGIGVEFGADVFGCWLHLGWIGVPSLDSLAHYYAALHELGHLVGPDQSLSPLEREVGAWVWALGAARWPPDDDVRLLVRVSLASHTWEAIEEKEGRLVGIGETTPLPPADSEYWTLIAKGTLRP